MRSFSATVMISTLFGSNSYYFQPGIHITDKGYSIIGYSGRLVQNKECAVTLECYGLNKIEGVRDELNAKYLNYVVENSDVSTEAGRTRKTEAEFLLKHDLSLE